MKKVIRVLFIICVSWLISGCKSVPDVRKVYDGPVKQSEELSYLFMVGEGSFPVNIFKIDGKNCTDTALLWNGSFQGKWGGFNVALLPGSHSFEFAMLEENYVEIVTFNMEAGIKYEFRIENNGIMIYRKSADGETAVDVKHNRLSPYKEPEISSPHGTLIQSEETEKEGSFSIIRLDGLAGSKKPSFYEYNKYVASGNYELMLTPGKHVLEFSAFINKNGKYYVSREVYSREVKIEAGKKYKFRISNLNETATDFTVANIEFVSFK